MADILVFGAHPDDAEFGMGASLVRFVRSGASVAVCVLTRGEAGTFGTSDQREEEMRAAASKLGGALEILSFRDCQISDSYEARVALAGVVRKFRPRLVFAPYHTNDANHNNGASHPDHMATGAIARSALRFARFAGLKDVKGEPWNAERILYYMVPIDHTPTLLNDVTPHMAEWESIARCHQSQMSIRDGKILEVLRFYRMVYGSMIGVTFAEAFISDDPLSFDMSLVMDPARQPEAATRA